MAEREQITKPAPAERESETTEAPGDLGAGRRS